MRTSSRARKLQLGLIAVLVVGALAAAIVLTRDDAKDSEGDITHLTLFMSFIPSVQFAPVYMAIEQGYFADEGIAITIEHGNEADGLERIARGDLRFGLISGEQVILARGQNRPVVYVFEWYHNFPVGIVSPAAEGITQPADLTGRVVGVPGPFGASYIGLRALLRQAEMTEDDLGELRSIGYAAPDSICAGEVDAAVVYIANEPLTIERQCTPVNVIKVSDYAPLVSNGLVTNEQTIRSDPELVRGMVRALQRGVQATLDDPDTAFQVAVTKYVTDLPKDQYDTQRQVLQNSTELWRSDEIGMTNPASWELTQSILVETGLLAAPLEDLTAAYTVEFVPQEPGDQN